MAGKAEKVREKTCLLRKDISPRRCGRCGETKPIEDFSKGCRRCRACNKEIYELEKKARKTFAGIV